MTTKIQKYEEFVNEKLKPALEGITKMQQFTSMDITEYTQLAKLIKITSESGEKKIKTKVDLGFHCYMQAVSENDGKYFVDLGHGFYAELTCDEATAFIEQKLELLEAKLKSLNKEAAGFQGQIRFVLEGIRELTEK